MSRFKFITRTVFIVAILFASNFIKAQCSPDVEDPIAIAPMDADYQCIGDVPQQSISDVTGVTDNCTATPVVAILAEVQFGACPTIITREYSVTDGAGNQIYLTQTITVNDTQNPTASNPPTTNVNGGVIPAVDVSIITDESDGCTVFPTVSWVSDVSDALSCPETITRTYSVTDDCGNSISVTHTIINMGISCTSGIIENSLSKETIAFPNPTTGEVTVNLNGIYDNVKISLLNIQGRLVLIEDYSSIDQFKLNISDEPGFYFLNIEADNEIATLKIIKK